MVQKVMRAVIKNISKDPTAKKVRRTVPAEDGAEKGLHEDPEGVGQEEEECGGHDEAVFVHCEEGGVS